MSKVVRYTHNNGSGYTHDVVKVGKKNIETVVAEIIQNREIRGLQMSSFSVGEVDSKGLPKGKFETIRNSELSKAIEIVEELKAESVIENKEKLENIRREDLDSSKRPVANLENEVKDLRLEVRSLSNVISGLVELLTEEVNSDEEE